MAYTFESEGFASANAATATITPASTIAANRLVVVGINANDATAISANADSGGAWTEALDATPPSETAQVAIYWKITNGTEPASYTFDLGGSRGHGIFYKAFTYENTPTFDQVTTVQRSDSTSVRLGVDAYDGVVFPANSLAVTVAGKDNGNASGEAYTVVNNSYTNVVGTVNASRVTAGAHRIYTTGETGAGDILIDTADGDDGVTDNSYGAIIVFTDLGGGVTGSGTQDGGSVTPTQTGAGSVQISQVALTGTASLADENESAIASLANIRYEWFDSGTTLAGGVVDSGTFSTDGSGEATITISGSSLTDGQFGLLVLFHPSDADIIGIYRRPISVS